MAVHTIFRLMLAASLSWPLGTCAALVWETQAITLAARSNAKEVKASFHFKNTGRTAVAIANVMPSCGCLTVQLSRRDFAPGEEGTIKALLALEGGGVAQEETLAVVTDDAPGRPVYLRLHADIQPLIVASPEVLVWPVGSAPEEKSSVIVAASDLHIAALAVAETSPAGAAATRVEPVKAGTQYRLRVRAASTNRPQNFTVVCRVTFTDGTAQDVILYGAAKESRGSR